jgi:hypothetical protein
VSERKILAKSAVSIERNAASAAADAQLQPCCSWGRIAFKAAQKYRGANLSSRHNLLSNAVPPIAEVHLEMPMAVSCPLAFAARTELLQSPTSRQPNRRNAGRLVRRHARGVRTLSGDSIRRCAAGRSMCDCAARHWG